jgi:hypothetical protein
VTAGAVSSNEAIATARFRRRDDGTRYGRCCRWIECPVCGAALATPGGTDPEVCDDARCAGAGAGARAHTDGRTPTGAMMSRRKAGDAKCRHSQRGPDWGRGGDRVRCNESMSQDAHAGFGEGVAREAEAFL